MASHLASYEILDEIKKSPNGNLFKVRYRNLNQLRAIKEFAGDVVVSIPDFESNFYQNAMLWAQLNHQNIARVLDHFHEDGKYYLVTEYVDGAPIDEFCKTQSTSDVISLFINVLEAFNYAHSIDLKRSVGLDQTNNNIVRIVHADIKPSNIIVSSKNMLKITDFGLSQFVKDTSRTENIAFLPPEILTSSVLDARSDVFSLGRLLSHLLNGRKDVPNKAMKVIQIATQMDIERRFLSVAEMKEALLSGIIPSALDPENAFDFNLTGKTINGYQIKEIIGKGGMGVVYKAIELKFNRVCAIKQLNPQLLIRGTGNVVTRFKQEAVVLANLNHKNIVRTTDYFEHEDDFLIVMDLVEGVSLEKRLNPCLSYSDFQKFKNQFPDYSDLIENAVSMKNDDRVFVSLYKIADANQYSGFNPAQIFETSKKLLSYLTPFIKKPTLDEALHIFKQVLSAVNYAHNAVIDIPLDDGRQEKVSGIVHRDIKPSNILIDKNNNVKIIDFGIIKLFNSQMGTMPQLSTMGDILGTWEYMAPEQFDRDVSLKHPVKFYTDIYALGLLLFYLLTGRPAFNPDWTGTVFTVLDRIRLKPVPNLHKGDENFKKDTSIPQQVMDAIIKATEKDPQKRFQNVKDFEKFLFQHSIIPDPEPPNDDVEKIPVWVIILCVFAIIVVGISLYFLIG